MQKIICLGYIGFLFVFLPQSALAGTTDFTDKLINISASMDDETTKWRDENVKAAVEGDFVHLMWCSTSSVDDSKRIMYVGL